ncbi:hypothetical protein [Legionella sp. PL877]|nr:hypothetical protein [Legionella sp. PL877]MDI9819747.1 hypothetical protein [Legionella sp. PL877]
MLVRLFLGQLVAWIRWRFIQAFKEKPQLKSPHLGYRFTDCIKA